MMGLQGYHRVEKYTLLNGEEDFRQKHLHIYFFVLIHPFYSKP